MKLVICSLLTLYRDRYCVYFTFSVNVANISSAALSSLLGFTNKFLVTIMQKQILLLTIFVGPCIVEVILESCVMLYTLCTTMLFYV